MKKLLIALALCLSPTIASAQCNGVFAPNTICGNLGGASAPARPYSANNLIVSNGLLASSSGVSGSSQTTTGTITAGTSTLTLAAAKDFVNNQGILINHGGPAFAVAAPSGVTVAGAGNCGGSTPCATTYTYYISACNGSGGYGAPVNGTTAVGANNIGNNTWNQVSWTGTGDCFLVWRQTGAGTPIFIGGTAQTSLVDSNSKGAYPVPFWATATPPGAAAASWLVTTISSGGGTTTLTLAANAGTNVSGGLVQHDDTAAFNGWMNTLNSTCQNGSVAPNSTIRLTIPNINNFINCSNVVIDGFNTTLSVAGASSNSLFQTVLSTAGASAGSSTPTYCMIGQLRAKVGSTAGFSATGYIDISALSPGSATYEAILPYKSVGTGELLLADACPVNFYDQVRKYLIGGTIFNNGDTVTITFTSTSLPGSPVSATYTLGSGENASTVTDGLAIAINNNATLAAANINAWHLGNGSSSDNTVYIGWPHNDMNTVTFSTGKTGTGNETLTGSTDSNYAHGLPTTFTQTNVTIQNWNIDGSNVTGSVASAGNIAIYFIGITNSKLQNISVSNYYSGNALIATQGYQNTISNFYESFSGNAGWHALDLGQTRLTVNNIFSHNSNGFAIGLNSASWFTGSNIHVSGAAFRCIKLAGAASGVLSGIATGNCGDTGISITWGTTRFKFFGVISGGSDCLLSSANGEGVWTSDDFNRFNTLMGVTALGACLTGSAATTDISISHTDTNNDFWAAQYLTLFNQGNAVFH